MEHPDAEGQVFNIGYDEEVSIAELAEIVKVLTGSSSDIVFVPYSEAYEDGFEDMPRRVPDISKVRDLIGFRPSLKLEEIVTAVIDYHRPFVKPHKVVSQPAAESIPVPAEA
jgi:UDP-glucose 4-epimerase